MRDLKIIKDPHYSDYEYVDATLFEMLDYFTITEILNHPILNQIYILRLQKRYLRMRLERKKKDER